MVAAQERPPAVLIVNPASGSLVASAREEVVTALGERFDLRSHFTTERDAGIGIAAGAVEDGASLVIAFGGDGHVNEVANGLAGTGVPLGIVPGGTMNVFARALGIPTVPRRAIEHLVERLSDAPRKVHLGRMDDRYFTFSAGCGFDAEAAERVEAHLRAKRRMGEVFFFWSAFRVLATSYRHRSPTMTLQGSFGRVPVAMAIACNAGPYAYLAGRPVTIAPQVSLDSGLDIFALRSMRIEALPLYAWRAVVSHDFVHHPDTFYASDLDGFELSSDKVFRRHVDGEPLTPASTASFSIERDVLAVVA